MEILKIRMWNEQSKKYHYDVENVLTCLAQQNVADGIMESRGFTMAYDHKAEGAKFEQYIGKKDKKGNDIYVGDIVRWDDMSDGKTWRVAVVEMNPDIQFRIIKIDCDFVQSAKEGYVFKFGRFIYTDTENHLEIIGNINQPC